MAPKKRPTATKDATTTPQSFDVQLQFDARVIAEHLGKQKYSTTTRAIGELVANAFDADATWVDITIAENDLAGIDSITITDNGHGMTRDDVMHRFGVIGVRAATVPGRSRLGRFGVGRLGVFRIGSLSEWSTVAVADDQERHRLSFTLRESAPQRFTVTDTIVSNDEPTGTRVQVFNIYDTGSERPTESRVAWDIAAQFCSYLIGNAERRHVRFNGKTLALNKMIESRETETLSREDYTLPADATLTHLMLKMPVESSRFPAQLLYAAKGVTVQTGHIDEPPSPNYLGIVESPYLDDAITSNREAFIVMDSGFAQLSTVIGTRIDSFAKRLRVERKDRFIERVRQMKHYPFRGAPQDAVTVVEQTLFDRVVELLHMSTNLENLSKKQQEMVFGLLHRSLGNEHLLEVLDKVAALSDDEMRDFREVLERTTLQSIIRLASEVTERLTFLNFLDALVYGEEAKQVRERSQLHKVLEPNCWIFGPQFYLATSDKGFRNVIRRHRELAKLEPADERDIAAIRRVKDIPDLFLASTKEYPLPAPEKSNHHVIVELKRPSVQIGMAEIQQIIRYGTTLSTSQQFDQQTTQWDLFAVSTAVHPECDLLRKSKDRPEGCIANPESMRLWVLSWGEIIQRARSEMMMVREHLKLKSEEISTSDYLRQHFPDALRHSAEVTGAAATPAPAIETLLETAPVSAAPVAAADGRTV